MDSHSNAFQQTIDKQNNASAPKPAFLKPIRVARLSNQQRNKHSSFEPSRSQSATHVSGQQNLRRKPCSLKYGGVITLLSTVIHGRLLVSPWPDELPENSSLMITKTDSLYNNNRSEKVYNQSRNIEATLSKHLISSDGKGRRSVKGRMPITNISKSTHRLDDTRSAQHSKVIYDDYTRIYYHRSSKAHPVPQTSVANPFDSHTKRKEHTYDRTTPTTATLLTIKQQYDDSDNTENVVRDGVGREIEGLTPSSTDTTGSYNLDTYHPPAVKMRRTIGQIIEKEDSIKEAVPSSIPSMTSSVALATGIEEINEYLEHDLRGFSKLSY